MFVFELYCIVFVCVYICICIDFEEEEVVGIQQDVWKPWSLTAQGDWQDDGEKWEVWSWKNAGGLVGFPTTRGTGLLSKRMGTGSFLRCCSVSGHRGGGTSFDKTATLLFLTKWWCHLSWWREKARRTPLRDIEIYGARRVHILPVSSVNVGGATRTAHSNIGIDWGGFCFDNFSWFLLPYKLIFVNECLFQNFFLASPIVFKHVYRQETLSVSGDKWGGEEQHIIGVGSTRWPDTLPFQCRGAPLPGKKSISWVQPIRPRPLTGTR